MTSVKLSNFQDAPPPLSIYDQNSFTPLTSDVQFQPTPPQTTPSLPTLQMMNNQFKENIMQGLVSYVISSLFQFGFRFQYQLINLVWISFDFF